MEKEWGNKERQEKERKFKREWKKGKEKIKKKMRKESKTLFLRNESEPEQKFSFHILAYDWGF